MVRTRKPAHAGKVWWPMTVIAGALVIALLCAAYACCTASGSRLVARYVLSRLLRPATIEINSARGSLLGGLTLSGVAVTNLPRWPAGHALTIHDVLLGLEAHRVRLDAHDVVALLPGIARSWHIARVNGAWPGQVVVHDLDVTELRWLPSGSQVNIQELELSGLPTDFRKIGRVSNGRLALLANEPMFFYGGPEDGHLALNVYCKTMAAGDLMQLVHISGIMTKATGTLTEMDLVIRAATWRTLEIAGGTMAQQLVYRQLVLNECPAQVALTVGGFGKRVQLSGTVQLGGGRLQAGASTIQVAPSTVAWDGVPKNPTFDLAGATEVQGVPIRLRLRGRPAQPELQLDSSPPLDQQRLLIMLITGKSFRSAERAVEQGKISTDLAKDFLDYLVFGGRASRLAHRLGISDVSLLYDPATKRAGASTTLLDRVTFTYEMEQPGATTDASAATTTGGTAKSLQDYTVGAEVKVTGDVSVGVEHEHRRTTLPTPTDAPDTGATGTAATDDSVLLKLKTKF